MPSLDLSDKSILVVDDVKFSRATVTTLLAHMGHPVVYHAAHGLDALARLKTQGGIDLVISDFNMPVMHGLQFLRAVRMGEQGVRRDMPFAMVTGYSEKFLVDSTLALDVNAFLIKPVSRLGLEKRLIKMLEQVGTDDWLKPANSYVGIDVDDALEIEKSIGHDNDAAIIARGVLLNKNEPLIRPTRKSGKRFTEDEIRSDALHGDTNTDEHGSPEQPGKPGPSDGEFGPEGAPVNLANAEKCAIHHVPGHAILAQTIYTNDGRPYIHSGEALTPRIISLLLDLHELGHPVEYVWIVK